MAELRFILLIAGLVFLVALVAWELRKPRQAQGSEALRRPTRHEPELGSYSEAIDEAARPASPASVADARRPVTPPPLIHAESILADADVLPVYDSGPISPVSAVAAAPSLAEAAAASAIVVPASAPESAAPAPAPLIVDWPPDAERHIVALRIVPTPGERLSGRTVRLAITACGFVHGPYGIYHRPDTEGRALLSVASLSKPGILDPINIDFQRLAGISLFTVLPGPLPPAAALDHLLEAARELSQRLPARVQDEHGQPLDAARLEDLRDRMQTLSASGFQAEPAA
jgi:FtsZ-interacting cell division protein ZipA